MIVSALAVSFVASASADTYENDGLTYTYTVGSGGQVSEFLIKVELMPV